MILILYRNIHLNDVTIRQDLFQTHTIPVLDCLVVILAVFKHLTKSYVVAEIVSLKLSNAINQTIFFLL